MVGELAEEFLRKPFFREARKEIRCYYVLKKTLARCMARWKKGLKKYKIKGEETKLYKREGRKKGKEIIVDEVKRKK